MPEGDTVWRTAQRLHEALGGTILTRTDFRVPRYATVDLTGQQLVEVVSRGKHLLMRTPTFTICSHLKMEGSWQVYALPRPRWRRPAHTARAILEDAQWQAVGFSLGSLDIVSREHEGAVVGHLGPDLLDPHFDADLARANVCQDPRRSVFLALHDQRNLAGFGNEYVNELLFLRGVRPTRAVSEVDDIGRLLALGHSLIVANAQHRHRSFGAETGGRAGTAHWVYGRAGRPCLRCGTVIRRGELGDAPGRTRITFWCPRCQPG